jgi:hypothetical protein
MGLSVFGVLGVTWALISDAQARDREREWDSFDAGHSVFLEAEIPEAELITVNGPSVRVSEIQSQLHYLIGPLNELNGGPRLESLETEQLKVEYLNRSTGLRRVKYKAKLLIAWDRYAPIPTQLEAVVPARADATGKALFHAAYADGCHEGSRSDVTVNNFWYHYRPTYAGCPLLSVSDAEQGKATRLRLVFSPSQLSTEGESPEYGKLWEDGKIRVTLITGKYASGAKTDADAGVASYNELYQLLLTRFGVPLQPVPFQGLPGAGNPRFDLQFGIPGGVLEVSMFLLDGVRETGPEFAREFGRLSRISDLVIYSGHAGLGANIRALNRLAQVEKGRYQIYVLNGCDTFAYLDDALFDLHARANPGQKGSRTVDVVSNALPSYFIYMAETTLTFLDAVVRKTGTYREILQKTDPSQRSIVQGEEDNRWPAPFEP